MSLRSAGLGLNFGSPPPLQRSVGEIDLIIVNIFESGHGKESLLPKPPITQNARPVIRVEYGAFSTSHRISLAVPPAIQGLCKGCG